MINLEIATVWDKVDEDYITSQNEPFQGTRKKAQRQEKYGWTVKYHGRGGGNWLLTKPAQTMVTLKHDDDFEEIDLADEITDFYGKDNMSKNLFNRFIKEVDKKEIEILRFSDGNFVIMKTADLSY